MTKIKKSIKNETSLLDLKLAFEFHGYKWLPGVDFNAFVPQKASQKFGLECKMTLCGAKYIYEIHHRSICPQNNLI